MKAHQLPVYQHKERILEVLKSAPVVIVESPTGSGKTTQLPIILHEAGYTDLGMIGITQPRRIATLGVSDFVAKQLKVSLGEFVGYKMRFEDRTSPRTRLKVMTDGILLQELKTDPKLSAYSVIMVDEAHERSLNIDFILGLLKQILQQRSDLKVIISSATINVATFSQYFNHAPVVSIDTPTYPVAVIYDPPIDDQEESLVNKTVEIVERIVLNERKAGDMLIFMPGERAIKLCMQALYQSKVQKKLWILPLYGMLAKEEQERVFVKAPFGKSKIVIATNIAETSITIDGIRTVIDSGLLKENIYNQRTYTNSLVQDLVSRAAAEQRKGRAGRTAAGICYRLYSKEAFNQRPAFGKEEIFRTDLSEVVLRMAGLGVKNFLEFDFINKPSRAGVSSGLETLDLLGAVDKQQKITNIGNMLLQLPLLPRHGRILVEAITRYPQVVSECTIACAFLSTNNPYLLPLGQEIEARAAHQHFDDKQGDFLSYLQLYHAFEQTEDKEDFCKRYYLDLRTMQEIVNVKQQLEEIVHAIGGIVGHGGSTKDYLMCCMRGLIQFICVQTGGNTYRSLTTDRIMIHPGSNLFKQRTPIILAGEIVKTTRMYARSVSKLERSWVEELDGELWRELKSFMPAGKERAVERQETKTRAKEAKNAPNFGVQFGSLFFAEKRGKSKKFSVQIAWESLWQELERNPRDAQFVVNVHKGARASLVYKGEVLLSGLSLRFALEYALLASPKELIVRDGGKVKPFDPQKFHQKELETFLEQAMRLGSICLSKSGRASGFLMLETNKQGLFQLRSAPKFSLFVQKSTQALEYFEQMHIVSTPEQQVQLNQIFERLASFVEI